MESLVVVLFAAFGLTGVALTAVLFFDAMPPVNEEDRIYIDLAHEIQSDGRGIFTLR